MTPAAHFWKAAGTALILAVIFGGIVLIKWVA